MKLIISFITYGKLTAKYLPYFLPSLERQAFSDFKMLAIDNSEVENNENSSYIKKYYPSLDIEWAGENIGFARAYNKMINKAVDLGAEYILVINPDIILEPDAILKMVQALDNERTLGSVSPKIRQWNFADNKKIKTIDTCGLQLRRGLRFIDAGQGESDKGQYDDINILGPSGAAAMYRLNVMEKVKQNGQYFDELMFMYKEDCDLAYRLFLAGFKSKCVSDAIVYHDRTTGAKGKSDLEVAFNRKNKSRQVKKWSFLNQQIIYAKYWRQQDLWSKLVIIWQQVKMLAFILLFERYLLMQLKPLWQIRKKITIYQ